MAGEAANPFTRGILKQIDDPGLREFVARWDALEFLVIRVFRGKFASRQDEAEYRLLRTWLNRNYPLWKAALQPYWEQSRVAGEPARQDPFLFLLSGSDSRGFVGNWAAMQHLPAAREALNQFLIDRVSPQL